jgi:hypothetical protein
METLTIVATFKTLKDAKRHYPEKDLIRYYKRPGWRWCAVEQAK